MDKTLESLMKEMESINKQLEAEDLKAYDKGRLDGRKFVLDKEIKEYKLNQPIPETLAGVRKEMELILGKSLFEGIEYESEYGIGKNPDEQVINKIQNLKIELRELLKEGNKFKERIDEVRMELFILLEVDPYTYNNNKQLIDALEEPDKTRFANLKAKHEELMKKVIEDNKKTEPTKTEPNKPEDKNEVDKIRERMAEILYKDPKKAYDRIEHENEKDPERKLTEDEIKEFGELRDKLNKLLGRTKLIPVPENKPVPVPTPTPEQKKKKGRLVKAWESAKKFYKKHKKAILLVGGIVLFAVAFRPLLPAIMQCNSIWWHKLIEAGALAETGLPKVLNDVNLLIGKGIHATFNSTTGIWTLANGALLNEGAKTASILAALGKVAVMASYAGIGATLAIKNAYRLVNDKIQNRRNKKAKGENKEKSSLFEGMTNSFKKGYSKGKDFVKDKFSKDNGTKKDPAEGTKTESKSDPVPPKAYKFHNENLDDRMNGVINYYISEGLVKEEDLKALETLPKAECIAKFKEIITKIESEAVRKKNEGSKKGEAFTRTDLDPMVTEFINYCINSGVYIQSDIDNINATPAEEVNRNIMSDPRFDIYKSTFGSKEESKEKGKSK